MYEKAELTAMRTSFYEVSFSLLPTFFLRMDLVGESVSSCNVTKHPKLSG